MTPSSLQGRHLVLGVSGGIAAYKSCDLVRRLLERGASVQVVMTEAATRFVSPLTFSALSGRPVMQDPWGGVENQMPHITLSRESDGILVAPASADFMSRIAMGQTQDLLASLCLARDVPLWVAPAMNRQMWSNPATQENVARLKAHGVGIWGPAAGEQACGEVGDGRMLEPLDLVACLESVFDGQSPGVGIPVRGLLAGRKVVVTAGPTQEPIDPIRLITNRSSGQMGFEIARACAMAGASVTLVAGPVSQPTPDGVERVNVQTALEMQAAVDAALAKAGPADLFWAVAAVADWRPYQVAAEKLKKDAGAGLEGLRWTENPDILAAVAYRPAAQRPFCIGFAAETGDETALLPKLVQKFSRKGVDLLVGNIGPAVVGQAQAALTLFDGEQALPLPLADKSQQAAALVLQVAQRLRAREQVT
ncbi:Dfp Phosphopantothenoylcysteine synthetase/decarboxylase [Burkholderiales bacterium]